MYRIDVKMQIDREPWLIPVGERNEIFFKAYEEKKKTAVMIYTKADTSTFRYRGYNVQQATSRSRKWQTVFYHQNETDNVKGLLKYANLLIFCRTKWCYEYEELVQEARKRNIPVLYDVDDLVCSLDYLPMLTNALSVPIQKNAFDANEIHYDFWFAYISRHMKMAEMADGFVTTNPFLQNKLQSIFSKPCGIITNFLNDEQVVYSEECLRRKKRRTSSGNFEIGYFSGTPSHSRDFRLVAPEIKAFLEDHPDSRLKVVGFMEFPEYMSSLMEQRRVCFQPLVDFIELQRLTAEVDAGIVPLVENTFTNCKSELKYFEASVVGTVTLATPIYSYAHSIKDGVTGYLCKPGMWYNALERVYNDKDETNRICENACCECIERYYGSNIIKMIEKCYDDFIA